MQTVLIVEDEKMIRQGIRAMIQRSGVPVETIIECNNGQMALDVLASQKVDVMFTDIRMPKMDGIELVREMQQLPERPLTVVISGYDDFSYAVEMLRNGVREYLLKPVDRDKMREVLESMEQELEKKREEESHLRRLGCRQMKQVMLAETMTEWELESLSGRLDNHLLYPSYYVCCLEKGSVKAEERDAYFFLEEVGEGAAYVVSEENCGFLLKNELRDSYVGVSLPHHGTGELRRAWLEASRARKHAFCRCQHVSHYEETEEIQQAEAGNLQNGEKEELLQDGTILKVVQMIGTDKIKEALRLVEQFLGRIRRGSYTTEELEHYMEVLIPGIQKTYQNALEEKKEDLERFSRFYELPSVEVLMEELTGWMIAFHEKIDTRFEDYRNKQKMEQAIAYIRKNYSSDLNMAVVSNYVSMNYSLFSYAFKQYTGKNFVNYLKDLRMEEAKRLLAQTQLRVVEISQQVGYENEKHFMKIFKSVCGVSPTEYRKNMEFTKH
ncbi:MAG: response regulator [Eubacteriales bacterium]|nr:response regulator [Eubacteriales bacterium]